MCGQYDVARNGFALLIKTNEHVQPIVVFVKFSNHRPWRSSVIVRTSCLLSSLPCSCSFCESCKSIVIEPTLLGSGKKKYLDTKK